MLLDTISNMRDKARRAEKVEIPVGINTRIGKRVSSLRGGMGLTLDALAAKCAVSRSMLSLVERGESSPTAVVLEKIATGLGVPLATLFEDESVPMRPLSRASERMPWRDPQSGYVRSNISPPNYPSPIQIVEVMLPAGARVAYETGPREVAIHQQIWMQQGRIDFTLGRVTYKLESGDCLAMRLDAPTTFVNRTRKPAHYVVVIVSHAARLGRASA